MNLNRMIPKFITALLILTLNIGIGTAGWGAELLASTKNPVSLDFERTENAVYEYLKGSWCSKEKAELIMNLVITERPKTCVEIGTFTGSSALPLLTSLKYLQEGHAYLIDAWSNEEAIKGLPKQDPNTLWWSTLNMKEIKNQFLNMIQSWKLTSYCTVIHSSSEKAASKIDSIDFLHLDGNFSEIGALLDAELYLPKVKSGGYILISNVLVMIDKKPTKMKSLWPIFDQCEIVNELDHSNTILFKKK